MYHWTCNNCLSLHVHAHAHIVCTHSLNVLNFEQLKKLIEFLFRRGRRTRTRKLVVSDQITPIRLLYDSV